MAPLILYDRSRSTTDWKCPRIRYYNYEYKNRGIVKNTTSLPLFTGTTIHDCLATIAQLTKDNQPVDIDDIANGAFRQMKVQLMEAMEGEIGADEFSSEQATLTEGLIRGFYRHAWPSIMTQYPEILFIEKEMEYHHDGLVFMSKPDLVVTGPNGTAYVEYKSTSSKKEEWINSWNTAVQLHSTVKAIKATTGIEVDQVIVQGLYKGFISYGKQSSPMVYCYKRNGNPPFNQDQIEYGFKAGFKRYPVWELAGGCKKWVEEMPDAILGEQFPQTPAIFVNEDMVDKFFKQRAIRELEIAKSNHETDLDKVFPQRFDSCVPSFGWKCDYLKLCFGQVHDPLDEGFTFREPHHEQELIQQGE